MKVISGQVDNSNKLSFENTCKLISGVYNDPICSFDDECIENILIECPSNKIANVVVTYSKVKVLTKEGTQLYFPIQHKTIQMELKEGLRIINGLSKI